MIPDDELPRHKIVARVFEMYRDTSLNPKFQSDVKDVSRTKNKIKEVEEWLLTLENGRKLRIRNFSSTNEYHLYPYPTSKQPRYYLWDRRLQIVICISPDLVNVS